MCVCVCTRKKEKKGWSWDERAQKRALYTTDQEIQPADTHILGMFLDQSIHRRTHYRAWSCNGFY